MVDPAPGLNDVEIAVKATGNSSRKRVPPKLISTMYFRRYPLLPGLEYAEVPGEACEG
jgi:hypothetical protein